MRICCLKRCSKFTGEHPCRSVISTKMLCNFIEIALRHVCSPVNLLHIFRTTFYKITSGGLLLCTGKLDVEFMLGTCSSLFQIGCQMTHTCIIAWIFMRVQFMSSCTFILGSIFRKVSGIFRNNENRRYHGCFCRIF